MGTREILEKSAFFMAVVKCIVSDTAKAFDDPTKAAAVAATVLRPPNFIATPFNATGPVVIGIYRTFSTVSRYCEDRRDDGNHSDTIRLRHLEIKQGRDEKFLLLCECFV